MKKFTRMDKKARRKQILAIAVDLAKIVGYQNVKQLEVAKKAKVSGALVAHYFSIPKLKIEIIKIAVKEEILNILAQGLIAKDRYALKISEELKRKALMNVK